MAVTQSGYGKLVVFEDFHPMYDINTSTSITTYVPGTGRHNIGKATYFSDDEGTIGYTVDEANGVVALTSDVGDDDNVGLHLGVWIPNVNGAIVTEWRFKVNDMAAAKVAVFCGFTETLALDTPVMPIEFATALMTYNGTGQVLGILFDSDGTVLDFRATAGDAGAVIGTNYATNAALVAAGVRANETMTADEWYICRVELSPDGVGKVYLGHKGRGLDLILEATGLPVTNVLRAALMMENRSGAAKILEVDYGVAEGWRDWEVT